MTVTTHTYKKKKRRKKKKEENLTISVLTKGATLCTLSNQLLFISQGFRKSVTSEKHTQIINIHGK